MNYNWEPIKPLTEKDTNIDLASIKPLYESWKASRVRLQTSSESNFKEFNQRLIRRLSVETGILERLYDLDRGTTEALVLSGFVEDIVSHSSTNIPPSNLIDILRSQESAIQLVVDCIAKNRPLSKSIIHELHATITQNQDSTVAIDQFGVRREIPLLKGKFKQHPNNPRRPDESIHEYCPPEHVESEIDQLLIWLKSYQDEDPIIVAAWFHHRFTQIHPYQDGNGRLARALTTLILLNQELLPLVIDRDLRLEYIKALEDADSGNLQALALLFAKLERSTILQALSVDADAEITEQRNITTAVIAGLAEKFIKRDEVRISQLKLVNNVAKDLRTKLHSSLNETFKQLREVINNAYETELWIHDGGPDKNNAHWYKSEVRLSAKEGGKYANLSEDHYFVKTSMRAGKERLIFIVSFHHIGYELSGVMEATAFATIENMDNSEENGSVFEKSFACSLEPIVFTYTTKLQDINDSFERWIDAASAVAIKEFGDRL